MEEIPAWARSSGSLADNAYGRTLGEYREPFSKCFVLIIMYVYYHVQIHWELCVIQNACQHIALQNTNLNSFKEEIVFVQEKKFQTEGRPCTTKEVHSTVLVSLYFG